MDGSRNFLYVGVLLLAVASFLLSTCQNDAPETTDPTRLAGRMLVWHGWEGADAESLNGILDKFEEIHPNIDVRRTQIAPDALLSAYHSGATSGLGPDLLIGPMSWIQPLAEAELIREIDAEIGEDVRQRFLPAALETVQHAGKLYGLPMSLRPVALYYNKTMVADPAATLEGLLAQAAEGKAVAINMGFLRAFWGIPAFGGNLIDAEGRVILDRGGFANWLAWLKSAREQPGVILESNQEALSLRFQQGEVAYYVGDPTELTLFREALGADAVGVAPLPPGPNGNAGPFLNGDALMFSTISSRNQSELALVLARFLTNAEQQTVLMRQALRVPANVGVRVNARLNPAVNGFVAQSKTAVPLPPLSDLDALSRQGTDTYIRVLEGVQEPVDAAIEFTRNLNARFGFEVDAAQQIDCTGVGMIRLLHGWDGAAAEVLNEVIERFARVCPAIIVESQAVGAEEIRSRYRLAAASERPPELVLGSAGWIDEFATSGLIKKIDSAVSPELLQRYHPVTLEGMRTPAGLFGLPLVAEVQVLYYNKDFVSTPVRTLDDLLVQISAEHPALINTRFNQAYWGIQAFGGKLFDSSYRVFPDPQGFVDWLAWLQRAKANPGIVLGSDDALLRQQFMAGEAAYYVGSSQALGVLEEALGAETVGVATLPAGPEGSAGPLLRVSGFLFGAAASEEQTRLALEFVKYATAAEPQTFLLAQTGLVPANATVSTDTNSVEDVFVQQMGTSVLLPNVPQMAAVQEFGGDAYALVLDGAFEPAQAAQEIADQINTVNNVDLTTETFACAGEGRVTVWHSQSAAVTAAYEEVAASFASDCPGIQLAFEQRPGEDLYDDFVAAGEAGGGPDLLLAPHTWTGELAAAGLITDVADVIPPIERSRLAPGAVDAFRYEGKLYGVPASVAPVALYYNRRSIGEPAHTLDALLAEAAAGRRVALVADFYHGYWGVSAFGGDLFANSTLEAGEEGLAQWLGWLDQAQRAPGMVVEGNVDKLRTLFRTGRVAYFTAGPEHLVELQTAMGADGVGVTTLPMGPASSASPLMSVDGFVFNAAVDAAQVQLAAQVARYVASEKIQQVLMEKAHAVPANQTVNTVSMPAIAGFVIQAESARPVPNFPAVETLVDIGNEAYDAVLNGQVAPALAAANAKQRVDALLEESGIMSSIGGR